LKAKAMINLVQRLLFSKYGKNIVILIVVVAACIVGYSKLKKHIEQPIIAKYEAKLEEARQAAIKAQQDLQAKIDEATAEANQLNLQLQETTQAELDHVDSIGDDAPVGPAVSAALDILRNR
jgi:formylmethanofuran dehydrogenase subunit B